MLDWLSSKMAMMIAALIILSSTIGFFAWQNKNIQALELQNIADQIAGKINEMNGIEGNAYVRVTFKDNINGMHLNTIVGGKTYTINITQNLVIASQHSTKVVGKIIEPIHVWKPDKDVYESDEMQENDANSRTQEFSSGTDFIIERKMVTVSGLQEYHTFVYRY